VVVGDGDLLLRERGGLLREASVVLGEGADLLRERGVVFG
jgi:hypothetical protein